MAFAKIAKLMLCFSTAWVRCRLSFPKVAGARGEWPKTVQESTMRQMSYQSAFVFVSSHQQDEVMMDVLDDCPADTPRTFYPGSCNAEYKKKQQQLTI